MLVGALSGMNSVEDALSDPVLVQEFKRREYIIVMMADECVSFRRYLHVLSVKEQEIIIPLLNQEKDYYTLAEEAGVTVPVVRIKACSIYFLTRKTISLRSFRRNDHKGIKRSYIFSGM